MVEVIQAIRCPHCGGLIPVDDVLKKFDRKESQKVVVKRNPIKILSERNIEFMIREWFSRREIVKQRSRNFILQHIFDVEYPTVRMRKIFDSLEGVVYKKKKCDVKLGRGELYDWISLVYSKPQKPDIQDVRKSLDLTPV